MLGRSRQTASALKRIQESTPLYSPLADMNAALGIAQLAALETFVAVRREVTAAYAQALLKSRHVSLVQKIEAENVLSSFPVALNDGMKDVRQYALKKNVETLPAFAESIAALEPSLADQEGPTGPAQPPLTAHCPNARSLVLRCLLFPLYPMLGKRDVEPSAGCCPRCRSLRRSSAEWMARLSEAGMRSRKRAKGGSWPRSGSESRERSRGLDADRGGRVHTVCSHFLTLRRAPGRSQFLTPSCMCAIGARDPSRGNARRAMARAPDLPSGCGATIVGAHACQAARNSKSTSGHQLTQGRCAERGRLDHGAHAQPRDRDYLPRFLEPCRAGKPQRRGPRHLTRRGRDPALLARMLAHREVPILAVNMGEFGFITEVSKSELTETWEKLLNGTLGEAGG